MHNATRTATALAAVLALTGIITAPAAHAETYSYEAPATPSGWRCSGSLPVESDYDYGDETIICSTHVRIPKAKARNAKAAIARFVARETAKATALGTTVTVNDADAYRSVYDGSLSVFVYFDVLAVKVVTP